MDLQPASKGDARAKSPEMPWFRKLSSPTLFLIVSLTLVGGYFAFNPGVSFPEHRFSAHSDWCGQRRYADRPDAGDDHEADRRGRQQRAGVAKGVVDHEQGIGG